MAENVAALAAQVKALPLEEKLLVAITLIRQGRRDLALSFIENARFDLLAEKYLPAILNSDQPAATAAPTRRT